MRETPHFSGAISPRGPKLLASARSPIDEHRVETKSYACPPKRADPMEHLTPHTIITADWGKSEQKRRAASVDVETRHVARVPPHSARCLAALRMVPPGGRTLIGADVVLGIPEYVGRASGS